MNHLMNAKAKVVAWRYRRDGTLKWAYTDIPLEAGAALGSMEHETQELIPLTDHKAAMAELHGDIQRLTACVDVLQSRVEHFAQMANEELRKHEDAKESNSTLLSGLEALAGEWEVRALEVDSYADSDEDRMVSSCLNSASNELRKRIAELVASAGLEGK